VALTQLSRSAAHNNCLKLTLVLVAASGESQKKTSGQDSLGRWDMLDAIQISVALWAMIVCGGIKLAQVVHYLF
jgi:hypothetical protein